MHLFQFLEGCGGTFDLWPMYVVEHLFCTASTPLNVRAVTAFFYAHDVPLGVASRVYCICNPNKDTHHVILYAMGGHYVTFFARINARHMAQYYDVPLGLLLLVNGKTSQTELVLPEDLTTPPLNCTPLRNASPGRFVDLLYSSMCALSAKQAFNIMQL